VNTSVGVFRALGPTLYFALRFQTGFRSFLATSLLATTALPRVTLT
jgi:hypothetical protein